MVTGILGLANDGKGFDDVGKKTGKEQYSSNIDSCLV